MKRNQGDIQIKKRIDRVMRHQRGRKLAGHLAAIRPTPCIPRKEVPAIGRVRAREKGQNLEGYPPDGHQENAGYAEAPGPGAALEYADELEQEGELDEGGGEVERVVEHVEEDEVGAHLAEVEEEEVLAGAVFDGCVLSLLVLWDVS